MTDKLPPLTDLVKTFGPHGLAWILRTAVWVAEAERDHGLELAYYDNELLVFRWAVPPGEQIQKANAAPPARRRRPGER